MSEVDRRAFLRWLAASPLFATLASCADGGSGDVVRGAGASGEGDAGGPASAAFGIPTSPIITRPEDALDVFDLERVAAGKIPGSTRDRVG